MFNMIHKSQGARTSVFLSALLGAALALSAGAPALAQKVINVKLATATVNDVQTEAIKRYAQRIEQRSQGRIKTELYPGAQLGSNQRMIEGLQLGSVQVYVGPPSYLVGLDPRFQVLDSPSVFTDSAHAEKVMADAEFRDLFLALGEKKGVKGVSLFLYGQTSYATRSPLRKLSDFKGQKLRVLSSEMERQVTGQLGAVAVPIDFSEIVPSLQQGTIDGVKTGIAVFTSLKLYEIVKYVTDTHEAIIPEVMMVSKRWFDAQPKDIQQIMVEEGKALEPELNAWALKSQNEAAGVWKEHGGEIFKLSAEDQADLAQRLTRVAGEVYQSRPAEKEFYELLLKVAAKHSK